MSALQVLMDPVCMLTIYPQLLRNFVYKMPNFMRLNSLLGFVDSLRFVFSRDLMVAEVTSSHFQPSVPACLCGKPPAVLDKVMMHGHCSGLLRFILS